MEVLHFYQIVSFSNKLKRNLVDNNLLDGTIIATSEICYNIEIKGDELDEDQLQRLLWLITRSDNINDISSKPINFQLKKYNMSIEIGPRLNFCTPLSTNAVCILKSLGFNMINRFEISHIYHFSSENDNLLSKRNDIIKNIHDKMTEMAYPHQINSFNLNVAPSPVFTIDIMNEGIKALEEINKSMGLAMDEWDLLYYHDIFVNIMQRNPSNVECFDLAQSNSEHSRHWFFKGQMIIDGVEMEQSLFDMLTETQKYSNQNNVIAFSDNSSAIKGFTTPILYITDPAYPSVYEIKDSFQNVCFTAETHNFPTGVAPFPGAATGTGGRIRDIQAVGMGGYVVAGTAGYCFGNLRLPYYTLPWETDPCFKYPSNFAQASKIVIEASNGASDYGNEFGEPVINGFCRSFGMITHSGEWKEWIKPIMFSGGIGQLSSLHVNKSSPNVNQLVIKIGGPVYRIGVGGGAASSVEIQGDSSRDKELDLGAVQRGDAQMENKMNRVIRGCIDLRDLNPIKSIHDQGAGGNGNVLKELVDPLGAIIDASNFTLGDPTINLLELWGAEYQESNGLLIDERHLDQFKKICDRERCPINVVGKVTGDGNIRLINSVALEEELDPSMPYIVDLDLNVVLGKMPKKKFYLKHVEKILSPLKLPLNLQVEDALSRVLRLPSVGSKRFLTNKVDRSVSGLIAQQQCVGPLHTPLADVAIVALSYFDIVGAATAIGEQPIKMLINVKEGAKLCVIEALTNLCMIPVTSFEDIKVSGNWMWPAKLPGEGAALWDACNAFCSLLKDLKIAIDGGKDSLSMAATVNDNTVVKSPGSLVVSAYVCCPDIRLAVTPDLKGDGSLIWIRMNSQYRLGGSALAQVYCQLGDKCPEFDNVGLFKKSWNCLQKIFMEKLASAAHDISDGGLIGCLLEMAFAGNVGIDVKINASIADCDASNSSAEISILFNEETGWIIEVPNNYLSTVINDLESNELLFSLIGHSCKRYEVTPTVTLTVNELNIFSNFKLGEFRTMWEDTSYHLEKLQCNTECVNKEYQFYGNPNITSNPFVISDSWLKPYNKINSKVFRVAILREEGSNGDREMAAAFIKSGFETWDITMQDLLSDLITLEEFNGLIFVGGFSFGDVLGSAKGWAAAIKYNEKIKKKFQNFKIREDTFSLGVCNGCQLMTWLGWLNDSHSLDDCEMKRDIILSHNDSNRFESRFSVVSIPQNTKSIMLSRLLGARLGVWVAHGEGKFEFTNQEFCSQALSDGLIALNYVNLDATNDDVVNYPFNPNGSISNVAGLCSKDGRHLAIMPHPERSFMWWQWAYTGDLDVSTEVSPWMCIFNSAYEWVEKL